MKRIDKTYKKIEKIPKKYNNNDIKALLNIGGKKTKTEGIKKTKSVNNKVTIVMIMDGLSRVIRMIYQDSYIL